MKDNFSKGSREYSKYRPYYPAEVYEFIITKLKDFDYAWDCGTGNGQVASELSTFFTKIEATDISLNQIKYAIQKPNINYSVQPAEKVSFRTNQFDLIISAQAAHWFDFENFYKEVKRCLKPEGLIVLLGYGLLSINAKTNPIIEHFYKDIIGAYWDEERKYLDQNYHTIPFPFKEINTPDFVQKYEWDIEHLLGYLRTWSAVKHFQKENNQDPVCLIEAELKKAFGKKNKVTFPILMRMGRIS